MRCREIQASHELLHPVQGRRARNLRWCTQPGACPYLRVRQWCPWACCDGHARQHPSVVRLTGARTCGRAGRSHERHVSCRVGPGCSCQRQTQAPRETQTTTQCEVPGCPAIEGLAETSEPQRECRKWEGSCERNVWTRKRPALAGRPLFQ